MQESALYSSERIEQWRSTLARISQRPTNSWVDEGKTASSARWRGAGRRSPPHLLQSGACVGRTIVNLRKRISSRPIEGRKRAFQISGVRLIDLCFRNPEPLPDQTEQLLPRIRGR